MPDEFVPLDTTRYTSFHRELAAKSVIIDANLRYVDQHRKSLQRDYKTFDDYCQRFEVPQSVIDGIMAEAVKKNIKPKDEAERQRTLPYLRLQLKALIARDLWGMNEYFYIMGETNDALTKALSLL
jgi:carboxyl-terminal processing protease